MKLKVNDTEFNLLVDEQNLKSSKIPVVFLHGFTGSAYDWSFIFEELPENFYPIAIDLIGHGSTGSPDDYEPYQTKNQIEQLSQIFQQLNLSNFVLTGYSMGGRLALSYAVTNPKALKSLILESTSPGIDDAHERHKRYFRDTELAEDILEFGVEEFVDKWLSLPLFNTLKNIPQEKQELLKAAKKQNDKTGLSNSLRGFSPGIMPSQWDNLSNMSVNTLLITGELDDKFTIINDEMENMIPKAEHKIVRSSGHVVHLEKPEDFINLVNYFLSKII
jgi:2-succinyl-6-hydroxy-2,4-cyclohexadiene-1-carboxylate synthase